MIGVGLDFGTSNSTAAWYDGTRLNYVRLEADGPVLPTAIHLDRDFVALTGQAAIERYVEENRGRRVEMVAEVIGEAASSIGGADTGDDISHSLQTKRNVLYGPLTDRGLPGRLFHGLKRLLGDPNVERLSVFERQFRIVALLTPILQRMRTGIQADTGSLIPRIHVGRPVNFEGRSVDSNSVAVARLAEACRHAGLRNVRFFPEPVAATLSYLWRERPVDSGTALTVDFGGGTLDLAVLRYAGATFDVLGTAGIALGGDKIDQLIYQSLLFPLLGKGEPWRREVEGHWIETLFPFEEYEAALLNWPITHTLNQNRTKSMVVDRIARGGPAAVKFERLHDLIRFNYSYNCFQAIRRAKAALSDVEQTVIDIPELNLQIPFTRAGFDALLAGALASTRDLVEVLLRETQLTLRDIDVVIRTGGTSQIVAVRNMLEQMFPGRVVAHDPFTSVAGGLAIANYQQRES
jgi:hypothetical chaperone protein